MLDTTKSGPFYQVSRIVSTPRTLMKPQVPSQNSSLTHLCYLPAGRPKNAEKFHWRPLKLQHFQKIWDKLAYTGMNLHMTHTQIRELYSTV